MSVQKTAAVAFLIAAGALAGCDVPPSARCPNDMPPSLVTDERGVRYVMWPSPGNCHFYVRRLDEVAR